MSKELICIVCPMGCHLKIDQHQDTIEVSGNRCPRGAAYGKQETICPMRTLTTTIRIHHAIHPLLPVITSKPVPKQQLFDIMKAVQKLEVEAPIRVGTILMSNVAGSGADLLATRTMEYKDEDKTDCNTSYSRS